MSIQENSASKFMILMKMDLLMQVNYFCFINFLLFMKI